jgi:hypothetical protein
MPIQDCPDTRALAGTFAGTLAGAPLPLSLSGPSRPRQIAAFQECRRAGADVFASRPLQVQQSRTRCEAAFPASLSPNNSRNMEPEERRAECQTESKVRTPLLLPQRREAAVGSNHRHGIYSSVLY